MADVKKSLKDIPDIIEKAGGSRVQLRDHLNDPSRAATLSEVLEKLKNKGGSVAKMVNNPIAKKTAAVLGGPVVGGLLTAQDALASEDVGLGSDIVSPYQNEEALLEVPPENFADRDVSDQARRWQKIRSLMEK